MASSVPTSGASFSNHFVLFSKFLTVLRRAWSSASVAVASLSIEGKTRKNAGANSLMWRSESWAESNTITIS